MIIVHNCHWVICGSYLRHITLAAGAACAAGGRGGSNLELFCRLVQG